MHLKRWITSIVAIPLIFLLVFSGSPFLLSLLLAAATLIALWEFFRIAFKGHEKLINFLAPPAYFAGMGVIAAAHFGRHDVILMILCIDLIFTGVLSLPLFKFYQNFPEFITKQVLSLLYIPVFISFLIFLRQDPEGRGWVFLVLCLVAAGDVGAYYVGSYFGKHKLCPAVSPKKTIEGSLGGICANIIIGLIFAIFFIPTLTWQLSLVISVVAGAAGQVGISSSLSSNALLV